MKKKSCSMRLLSCAMAFLLFLLIKSMGKDIIILVIFERGATDEI